MINQKLHEARIYEENAGKMIKKEERPDFHLSVRTGWMNDPNGFSYYNGKYHMFYQYYPYDTNWNSMHWGHAVSVDLLHWEYLSAAMAPDEEYDKDGCFSGSAITLSDGRHLLMYTGVVKERQESGEERDIQTQCLAVGDGVEYTKYEKNPVLDKMNLPEGSSRFDFRDPKIWQKKDGTYCCVVGNRAADDSGHILLFTSPDGFQWSFKKVFAENKNRFGTMWECPDFFELDGKGVLLASPQDMLPSAFEYQNGSGTLCLIGNYDEETDTFIEETDQSIDYGIDFYAPQTMLTPDGRRVMIGWMQNWETCSNRMPGQAWFGQMSLPRELSIKNNKLYQKPVRELEEMRKNQVEYQDVTFSDIKRFGGVKGRRIDMELTIRPEKDQEVFKKFQVCFAQDDQYHTSLCFDPKEGVLELNRKFSGSRKAVIHERKCKVDWTRKELKLRIILDRFSVEVFVNDGEQVLTATMYTDQTADGISFFADGTANVDIVKYDLV